MPVRKFFYNICGTEQDTVNSQKEMWKLLYKYIYQYNKSNEFRKLLEKADQNNDGLLMPNQLGFFIKYVTGGADSPFSDLQIETFVRNLHRT